MFKILLRFDASKWDLCNLPVYGFTSQTARKTEILPLLQHHLLLCQVRVFILILLIKLSNDLNIVTSAKTGSFHHPVTWHDCWPRFFFCVFFVSLSVNAVKLRAPVGPGYETDCSTRRCAHRGVGQVRVFIVTWLVTMVTVQWPRVQWLCNSQVQSIWCLV